MNRVFRKTTVFALIAAAACVSLGATAVSRAEGNDLSSKLSTFLPNRISRMAVTTGTDHRADLSGARVSQVPDGRYVVSMNSSGDLKGLLTLWIQPGPGGTISGGDWALVHAYTEEVEGVGESDGHPEGEAFINKGTLGGSITGGTFSMNADGGIESITGLTLSLTSGSLTYDGVQGTGTGEILNPADGNSTGTIDLNF
jgi:hypothetical protein